MTTAAACWLSWAASPFSGRILRIAWETPAYGFQLRLRLLGSPARLPKALVPAQKNLEHILRKQYVNGYVVFFNINICRNNTEDVRRLTDYAHDHRVATDYHINETPTLEQGDHFKHLYDNPTYIRPEAGALWTPLSIGSSQRTKPVTRW